MKRKVILVLASAIAFIVISAIFLIPRNIGIDVIIVTEVFSVGDEISNYPYADLSINFTSYATSMQFHENGYRIDADNGSVLAVFNFTIRNTSSKTFGFNEGGFVSQPKMPSITYNFTALDGKNTFHAQDLERNYGQSWKDCFVNETISHHGLIAPNESAKGLLVYMIPQQTQIAYLTLRIAEPTIHGLDLGIAPWTIRQTPNPLPSAQITPNPTPTPVTEQIQSLSNFYLRDSRIFVISANASYGSYPGQTVTSQPHGSIIAQNGERCIIINVALRNDYSIEFPPPNLAPEAWNVSSVYVFLTAHLYNGNNQIEATDITNPNAFGYWANNAYTQLDFGESTTVSIYLATSSNNVTSFQLHTNYIGELPPP